MRYVVIEGNPSLSTLEHESTDVLQKQETTLSNQYFSRFFKISEMQEAQQIRQK